MNEKVRVRFDAPRELAVPEDPSGVLAVRELDGQVVTQAGDSVAISVLRVRGDGRSYNRDGSMLTIARGSGTTIAKARFDVLGTVLLVATFGAVAGVVALTRGGSTAPGGY